jgi:hypothetical protein
VQVHKLRASAHGLVPAGAYFTDIAMRLEQMNARDASRRDELDDEDRALESRYRKRYAARATRRAEERPLM